MKSYSMILFVYPWYNFKTIPKLITFLKSFICRFLSNSYERSDQRLDFCLIGTLFKAFFCRSKVKKRWIYNLWQNASMFPEEIIEFDCSKDFVVCPKPQRISLFANNVVFPLKLFIKYTKAFFFFLPFWLEPNIYFNLVLISTCSQFADLCDFWILFTCLVISFWVNIFL